MKDYLLELGKNPGARSLINRLGLPIPLPQQLERATGPSGDAPSGIARLPEVPRENTLARQRLVNLERARRPCPLKQLASSIRRQSRSRQELRESPTILAQSFPRPTASPTSP